MGAILDDRIKYGLLKDGQVRIAGDVPPDVAKDLAKIKGTRSWGRFLVDLRNYLRSVEQRP